MIKFIKEFLEFRKLRKERERRCKRFVVTQAMITFFEDLQRTKGSIDLPPFICAHNEMQKIKSDKDLDRLYKKLSVAGLV